MRLVIGREVVTCRLQEMVRVTLVNVYEYATDKRRFSRRRRRGTHKRGNTKYSHVFINNVIEGRILIDQHRITDHGEERVARACCVLRSAFRSQYLDAKQNILPVASCSSRLEFESLMSLISQERDVEPHLIHPVMHSV
jgi:hypothetical protein